MLPSVIDDYRYGHHSLSCARRRNHVANTAVADSDVPGRPWRRAAGNLAHMKRCLVGTEGIVQAAWFAGRQSSFSEKNIEPQGNCRLCWARIGTSDPVEPIVMRAA